jgi:hypothetical protein
VRVSYIVPVVDFNSQPTSPIVVPDLQVEVCSGSCEQPLQRCDTDTPAPTQQCYRVSEGVQPFVMVFDMPFAFSNATLRLSAPGYAPLDYMFGGPLIGSPEGDTIVAGLVLPMLTEQSRAIFYADLGVSSVDPARGMLVVRALNCLRQTTPLGGLQGTRAAGLVIEATDSDAVSGAVAFRLSNANVPTPNELETDPTGVAGYANVQPRAIRVRAQAPGGEIANTLLIRQEVITIAELRPGLDLWGQ